jgi:hypothetical protein
MYIFSHKAYPPCAEKPCKSDGLLSAPEVARKDTTLRRLARWIVAISPTALWVATHTLHVIR